MLKDPTEFRKRFAAYKAGKMPYKDGRIVLEDEWDPNDTYTADAGMIKSKLAIASHFGNPTARRMANYDGRDYTWPGEYEYINGVGELKRGNVYVGSYGNLVTPQIQDNGKTLEFVDSLWNPENEQRSYKQSLKFDKMRDAWSFGENYKKYAPVMNRYENGKLPRYADGTFPDSFYKNLYNDKWNNSTPDVDFYQEAFDYSEKEALDYEKFLYSRYPEDYSVYGGQLPGVTVKPDPNSMSTVRLYTYYPGTSRYRFTGHSALSTEGGNSIDVRSDDQGYNFVFNNCSDATRRALEFATGKKLDPHLFTTPGDVKDFAESLGGKTYKHKNGFTTTVLQLPTKDVRNIAKYSKYLKKKEDDADLLKKYKWHNALENAWNLKRNNKYFKNVPIVKYDRGILKYEDGKVPYQKYLDATADPQNGRYMLQAPWNNPVILFFDPTGVSGYPLVKEAFENGDAYDKFVSIIGALPAIGKAKIASKVGSVVNVPGDTKSYLDWDDYYRSIIYKDNKSGSIGPRKYIGSSDYHDFKSLERRGLIRKATPDEIQWWYNWTNGDSASPGLPLGSAILDLVNKKNKPKFSVFKRLSGK